MNELAKAQGDKSFLSFCGAGIVRIILPWSAGRLLRVVCPCPVDYLAEIGLELAPMAGTILCIDDVSFPATLVIVAWDEV